ncbi:translation initiation factor IF-2 [Paracoccidioides brasiliensis Pb03]|nr:translation initiation factor IF-2 [Paracoccidioides brasiliensis Pb03]
MPGLCMSNVHWEPRRQFNSTSPLSKPPAGAAAAVEQYEDDPPTQPVSTTKPVFGNGKGVGGGFAGGGFGIGLFGGGFGGGFNAPISSQESTLTTEETKQRDVLRRKMEAQKPPAPDRTKQKSPLIRRGDFVTDSSAFTFAKNAGLTEEELRQRDMMRQKMVVQPTRFVQNAQTDTAYTNPTPSTDVSDYKRISWNCLNCKHLNPSPSRVCPRCGVPSRLPIQHSQPDCPRTTSPTDASNVVSREASGPLIIRRVSTTISQDVDTSPTRPERSSDVFSGFRKGRWSEEQQQKEEFIEAELSKLAPTPSSTFEKQNPMKGEEVDDLLALEVDPQAAAELIVESKQKNTKKKGKGRDENGDDGGEAVRASNDLDYDREMERLQRRRLKEQRKQQEKEAKRANEANPPIYLPEFITVGNLADALGIRPADFLVRLADFGFEEATYNHILDAETAGLIASEFNFNPIIEDDGNDLVAAPPPQDTANLPPRPPVVTIMGHVDHGKTTLLDWLRKSSIVSTEHGGITQHIGAFSVTMPSGKVITFLDTPGHAAFLDMRRRGANVTDIVILVVAADDSVKPQTIEAIKHAKEANVPIIVAISKIDKPSISVERVKQDLARHNVHVEDIGGDVQAICVSGKTGEGMLDLEEATVTLSEMLDHRAEVDGKAEGWVIEATTKKHGRVATVLVKRGTLRPGDIVVAGTTWAKVRTLKNEAGVLINEALPGTPVEVDGWKEQPQAGNEVLEAESEQQAKSVIEYRLSKVETKKLSEDIGAINKAKKADLEKRRQELQSEKDKRVSSANANSGPKGIPFLIKADVSGSVEALVNSVSSIGNNEVYARILRSGVGPIGEFDIQHAAVAQGNIITFNLPVEPAMARMAEAEGVRILNHNIIYELIDDVKSELSEYLPPAITQHVTGEAEVGQIFGITGKGRSKIAIAGCKVRNGLISRRHKVRVLRDKEVIYDGNISSLKNVKKDVTEMHKGTECGIAFEDWNDIRVGDHVQCYEEKSEKRTL